jgi:hypothetical protein
MLTQIENLEDKEDSPSFKEEPPDRELEDIVSKIQRNFSGKKSLSEILKEVIEESEIIDI